MCSKWCVSSVPKPDKDDAFFVCFAVAVGVLQVNEFGAVGDVGSSVHIRHDSGGNQQPVGEHSRGIGLAITVFIFQHQDFVGRFLSWFNVRIDLAAGDPQSPLRVEVHLNGFGNLRVARVQVHLEPVGDDERLAFQFRVGIRNVLQITLSDRWESRPKN